MKDRLARNEVAVESTWDLTGLFKTKDEFLTNLEQLHVDVQEFKNFKGRLSENGNILYEAVVQYERLNILLSSLGNYTRLQKATDGTKSDFQALSLAFDSKAARARAELSFFESELMTLTEKQFAQAFKYNPKLEIYRVFLTDIFRLKPYKLPDETEEALAALGEVTGAPYKTYSISKAADMVFDPIADRNGSIHPNSFTLFEGKYEFSDDHVLRKNAYKSFTKTLNQYKNTYASIYGTQVRSEVIMSRLRGYNSVIEMLLDSQKVTPEMYHRQIDVIYRELAPHFRRYAGLLKEKLGLYKVHFYDLKAPVDPSYNPPADYDEVKGTILNALSILGEEYIDIMRTAFDEKWIDYADNVGKSTGAFCAAPYTAHPYILVTFQNNMRDAFTLAHELGHAGHFALANKTQKFFNSRPSVYNVEAPSTMNEILLGRYLLNNSNDSKLRKWVILQFLKTYYHNFVTHLLEAAYQRKIYDYAENDQPLTAQLLSTTTLEILRGFWGDSVEIDDDSGLTWMRQAHYYIGLFPYTYSAGLTASTVASEMIFNEGQPAVDRWLKMLKKGGKLPPLELFKVAGVDLSSDKPVKKAIAYVGSLIDELIELS